MKKYVFQLRNRDGRRHFRRVAREHPSLSFVIVYHHPDSGFYGGFVSVRGRSSKELIASEEVIDAVMAENGVDYDSESDETAALMWMADHDILDWIEARLLERLSRDPNSISAVP